MLEGDIRSFQISEFLLDDVVCNGLVSELQIGLIIFDMTYESDTNSTQN
jgi:hypothetical protein